MSSGGGNTLIRIILLVIAIAITIFIVAWLINRYRTGRPRFWIFIIILIIIAIALYAAAGFI